MLTKREKEVLELICKGFNNREIAKKLLIITHTAKAHSIAVIRKLNAKNRTECAFIASKCKLVDKKRRGYFYPRPNFI